MFTPHPHLADEINAAIADSELQGGAWIDKLPVGKALLVQTQNTLYRIEQRKDGVFISGSARYCPEPVRCLIHGSTWGGSMLKVGFVGRGMFLEFSIRDRSGEGTILTSRIEEVTESQ